MRKQAIAPIMPHFFKFIGPYDPLQQLAIPKAFIRDYLGGESCEGNATLKTRRNDDFWTVRIHESSFKHGWNDFAKAQHLQPGDLLVFRHEGAFKFDVTVLDATYCEKEHQTTNVTAKSNQWMENHTKQKVVKDAPQFTLTLQPSACKWFALNIPMKFARENGFMTSENRWRVVVENPKGDSWKMWMRSDSTQVRISGCRGFLDGNKLKVGDVCTFTLFSISMVSKKILMKVSIRRSNSTV